MAAGCGVGSSQNVPAYEVFLSFTGEDVRQNFIDHLHSALKRVGITAFNDDAGLERDDKIQWKRNEAIESSKIAIVTFSSTYATSRWCLDELVKIMERWSRGLIVLPVFYRVDPTRVRHQFGPYEAFHEHGTKHEGHHVNKWRQALTAAADLARFGQNQTDGCDSQFVKHMVKEVVRKLNARQSDIPSYMVGEESSLVREISKWLQNGSSEVYIGIIYGQAGVGKTTTAKVVYNKLYGLFESSCFLAGVTTAHGKDTELIRLQKQLIRDITGNEKIKINSVPDGRQHIQKAIHNKEILVVLDDVDEVEQLNAMFDCLDWVSSGSKILITTRNQCLLLNKKFVARFEACLLDPKESIKLFSYHAFGQAYPPQDYQRILTQFIDYCGGLPVALAVLASSLRSIILEKWEFEYARSQEYLNETLFNVLKRSFDTIQHDTVKDIFLHIAFFMVGRKKEYALKILDGCGLHGMIGLENLISKYLVSVDKHNDTLMMHPMIQQMGYEIVRQEQPVELGHRSRLRGPKDAYEVLRRKTGTSAVKGLHLRILDPLHDDLSSDRTYTGQSSKHMSTEGIPTTSSRQVTLHFRPIKTDAFTMMNNLDLLLLENVQLEGGFEDFPKGIKWLLWKECRLEDIPSDCDLDELVVLDMQKSRLVHAWKGFKYMGALKILELSHSHHLVSTPDLSGAPMLEWISCEDCKSLTEIHESTGNLKNLLYLSLEGCIKLVKLPELKKDIRLNVTGCINLKGR